MTKITKTSLRCIDNMSACLASESHSFELTCPELNYQVGHQKGSVADFIAPLQPHILIRKART